MDNEHIILLVDDEPDIVEFLSYNLKKEGFKVYTASNGIDGIKTAKEIIPHLIVLDVMMPGIDGIETCSELKKIPALSRSLIMFLTARGEDYSQIAGLDAGADDYITKPIKPRLFISRVNALLRRYSDTEESITETSTMKIHDLLIDREKYIVIKQGRKIVLPKKEFELLYLLASKPSRVFTREEILSKIWGDNVIVGDRTIDVHIRKVREKIGGEFLTTVKGIGYKFESI
ncbi:MAG TPA: response regulator transcription factor [Bacteroidales bacterium]|nr:response regulator transcription factor [Bacteroidales bacterium]